LVDKEKSTVKTIRLSKPLEKSLEREARARRMSLNSFITSVLVKFDEWDRLADKFSMMTIPADVIMAILEGLNETQIQKIAKECGASISKAIIEFWFSRVTPDTFVKYLSLRSTYQHFVNHEVITGGEGQLIITARHNHGRKWSIWSCNYISEAIKVNFGLIPQFEINGNAYRIECHQLAKAIVT
jgi:hypothetical protein